MKVHIVMSDSQYIAYLRAVAYLWRNNGSVDTISELVSAIEEYERTVCAQVKADGRKAPDFV